MAKWSVTTNNLTFTTVADTVAFTNSGFIAMIGGTTTQSILCKEYYFGGLATVTSPMQIIFARDSTVTSALTIGTNQNTLTAFDPATAALAGVPLGGSLSTTKGQRSSTLYLQMPAFNANGGIVRWLAGPDEEPMLLGNTASFGEWSFTTVGGTIGAVSHHWIVEPK